MEYEIVTMKFMAGWWCSLSMVRSMEGGTCCNEMGQMSPCCSGMKEELDSSALTWFRYESDIWQLCFAMRVDTFR